MAKQQLTAQQHGHLGHWAGVQKQHAAVSESLEWCEKVYKLGFDFEAAYPGTPLDVRQLVDEFFEVNRAKLEDARRALLE